MDLKKKNEKRMERNVLFFLPRRRHYRSNSSIQFNIRYESTDARTHTHTKRAYTIRKTVRSHKFPQKKASNASRVNKNELNIALNG